MPAMFSFTIFLVYIGQTSEVAASAILREFNADCAINSSLWMCFGYTLAAVKQLPL